MRRFLNLSSAAKWFMLAKNRTQHVFQNIFLIAENDDNFITESGSSTFVIEGSEL